jgi:DNA-binding NarL/FixJ family response regulator
MSTRILIADDHQILRQGLRSLLSRQSGFEVIADVADGVSAIRQVEELNPDIAVIDVTMPDMDGIETTRRICANSPAVKVIALSMHADQRFVREMIRAGASGYLLKDDAFEELNVAIQTVMEGGHYFSKRLDTIIAPEGSDTVTHAPTRNLTAREREVLQLVAEGKSTKEVAFHLRLSTKTIETHRRQVMEKLNLYSVAELTKWAIREGLTTVAI